MCLPHRLIIINSWSTGGFPGGSVVKNPPAMQETWVWSPGQEDALEEEMTTHSNILAWDVLWTEKSGELQFVELQKYQTQLNNNNMANKVSHLLLILLPGGLKQITYLCQYVYLEYRLFFKMQLYITTVKKQKKNKKNKNCIKYPGRIYIFQPLHTFQYLICFLFIVRSNQDK